MLDYEGQGYHLFCDNFNSSVTLPCQFYRRGILYTGTILETRQDFPSRFKDSKECAKKERYGSYVVGEGPACPCFAMARQQRGVYDKHIRQCK